MSYLPVEKTSAALSGLSGPTFDDWEGSLVSCFSGVCPSVLLLNGFSPSNPSTPEID